ncbi:MAG: GNAT family N-acetyltransferase [Candidatus Hodarchaeales archaeon]
MNKNNLEQIKLSHIPDVEFRHFSGEDDDYQNLAHLQFRKVMENEIDQESPFEGVLTASEINNEFLKISNFNPKTDILIAQSIDGVIAYNLTRWWINLQGTLCLYHDGYVLPEWRSKGIGLALLDWSERKLNRVAVSLTLDGNAFFCHYVSQDNTDKLLILMKAGYIPAWGYVEMELTKYHTTEGLQSVRGIKIKQALEKDSLLIWEAEQEAFENVRGYIPSNAEEFKKTTILPKIKSGLIFIAWDKKEIAGVIICDTKDYSGIIDTISVRKPWRKKGIALALLNHGIQTLKKRDYDKIRLICESHQDGVKKFYEKVGFKVKKEYLLYMKPYI